MSDTFRVEARIGVAADDLARQRRADHGQVEIVFGLRQLRLRRLHGGDLRIERGPGRVDGVLRLVELLFGDIVVGRQFGEAVVFALRRADVDLGQLLGGGGLIDPGLGGLYGQALRVVLLTGQNLTRRDRVAFLRIDLAHDAGGAGGHLDHPALDIDLAVGDGGVIAGRHGDGGLAALAARRGLATGQSPGGGHQDEGGNGENFA